MKLDLDLNYLLSLPAKQFVKILMELPQAERLEILEDIKAQVPETAEMIERCIGIDKLLLTKPQ